jgi:hypothetical protein
MRRDINVTSKCAQDESKPVEYQMLGANVPMGDHKVR